MSQTPHERLDQRWYDAIGRRHSRRAFDGTPILAAQLAGLRTFPATMPEAPGARLVLVESAPPALFKGVVGSYGSVKNAPSAAAFIAGPDADMWAGYLGEALVLHATALDLETCWIAGMFDRKVAARVAGDLADDERVVAVTPIGHALEDKSRTERLMSGAVQSTARKELSEIAPSMTDEPWPSWAVSAVEAARRAPSGANRQPWRFRMQDGGLVLYSVKDAYWTARLDHGIAMLHARLGAEHIGVSGTWDPAEAPDVARFVPELL